MVDDLREMLISMMYIIQPPTYVVQPLRHLNVRDVPCVEGIRNAMSLAELYNRSILGVPGISGTGPCISLVPYI